MKQFNTPTRGLAAAFLVLILMSTLALSRLSAAELDYRVENPDGEINNAKITLLPGTRADFKKIKWSEASIPLGRKQAAGLTEGKTYTIHLTKQSGETRRLDIKIPAQSPQETLNNLFSVIVDNMAVILFWDPVAALGLYDPVMHDEDGEILRHANGDPRTQQIPLIVIWLVMGAFFFTLLMRFINLRAFKHAIDLVRGRYDDPNSDEGEVSHFQALATALSATVGLGNIAGVAVAISIGGPGAIVWMILGGFLGMTSKFLECTLGVKYRTIDKQREVSGGPMYYLPYAFRRFGSAGKPIGKFFAGLFAVLCIGGSFGGGNMFQANQAYAQLSGQFPALQGYGFWFGIILAVFVGIVIIGGIKSIAQVTEKIVPFMALLYVATALVIIIMRFDQLDNVLAVIWEGASSPGAAQGGFLGVLVQGFRRGAFSNEAGIGSASIAHSAARTKEPISEGTVALLEPFIDTIVVCTMTACVIIFTRRYEGYDITGAELTSNAFGSVFSWFPYLLVIAIFLFAFSTMISWSYYGVKSWTYLFGSSKASEYLYKLLFLVFVVVGSSVSLGAVIDFSDMMILAMAFPNIAGLLLLSGEVKHDLKDYYDRIRSGAIKRFK